MLLRLRENKAAHGKALPVAAFLPPRRQDDSCQDRFPCWAHPAKGVVGPGKQCQGQEGRSRG